MSWPFAHAAPLRSTRGCGTLVLRAVLGALAMLSRTMRGVSAQAVGMHMPAVVTLDDLAAMNAADPYGHRYETSPEGVLSVMPPPDSEHATIASRLFAWLITAGWPADQLLQIAGIGIPGPTGDGGRIPDVSVWKKPPPCGVWLAVADLLLVVEIVSPGSEALDEVTKLREYASAGIPRYWVVNRDSAQTVTLNRLGPDGLSKERAKMPLAWLLQTTPADHID
jgi:Uma2 family endonuclease